MAVITIAATSHSIWVDSAPYSRLGGVGCREPSAENLGVGFSLHVKRRRRGGASSMQQPAAGGPRRHRQHASTTAGGKATVVAHGGQQSCGATSGGTRTLGSLSPRRVGASPGQQAPASRTPSSGAAAAAAVATTTCNACQQLRPVRRCRPTGRTHLLFAGGFPRHGTRTVGAARACSAGWQHCHAYAWWARSIHRALVILRGAPHFNGARPH